jgi:hypothetical protein
MKHPAMQTFLLLKSEEVYYMHNTINLTLEKILIGIDRTNAVLEQIEANYKADIETIRNALKIGIDRSSSSSLAAGDAQT